MPAYKAKNGKWYASFYYETWQGERKKKKKEGFKTQREAKAFERTFIEKMQGSPDMTFGSLLDLYLDDLKLRVRELSFYGSVSISKSLRKYLSDIPIVDITPPVVQNLQSTLLKDGKSVKRVNVITSLLSTVLLYAQKTYGLPSNPCKFVDKLKVHDKKALDFWTLDEFNAFIVHVKDEPYRVIFMLLFYSGMRVGEVLALTLDDFTDKGVEVSKAYQRFGSRDILGPPKSKSGYRFVTLPENIINLVLEYSSKIYGLESSDRLFPLARWAVRRYMVSKISEHDLKPIRTHDLRHSHASFLIHLGYDPLVISQRLGHSDIKMTLQTYSHLYPSKHQEVAENLNNFI